ncbi:MAG: CerR family C-terminal domain-containing protein [Phycisphaeraceae bacterium]|nr:CerR family C-terminal domain-containing protein [Phycisphaeraceae bacterium]
MPPEPAETRARLLHVACKTFAEKGFRDSTIADISRKAKANIAAVNYHFGDKETLYKEAWRHAHQKMVEAFPPHGGVPEDAPPEQRLRGRIRSLLQRAMCEDGLEFQIMSHELASPTGLLNEVFRDTVRPMRQAMDQLVRQLLGEPCDNLTVRLCAISIIGPCLQILRKRHLHARSEFHPWLNENQLETMVEHFTLFALAGIHAIRTRHHDSPSSASTDKALVSESTS